METYADKYLDMDRAVEACHQIEATTTKLASYLSNVRDVDRIIGELIDEADEDTSTKKVLVPADLWHQLIDAWGRL